MAKSEKEKTACRIADSYKIECSYCGGPAGKKPAGRRSGLSRIFEFIKRKKDQE